MAARVARSIFTMRSTSASILSKRLFASAASERPPLPWLSRFSSSSESFRIVVPGAALLNVLQCRATQSASMSYSSFRDGVSEKELQSLGFDFKHWQVLSRKPNVEGAAKEQVIDDYVRTLAKVLGSEEEAKKKIYSVSCDGYFGFGAAVDEETAKKLEGAHGVLCVLPDVSKKYGGQPFVNGKLADSSRKAENEDDQVWTEFLQKIYEVYAKVEQNQS